MSETATVIDPPAEPAPAQATPVATPVSAEPPAGDSPATPPAGDPPVTPPAGDPPVTPPAGDPPAGDPPAANTWFNGDADWRAEIAGDDEAKLNVLKRYADPNAMATALFEARGKLNEKTVSSALPENATDEQVSEWRAANDVPATAAEYKLTLDEGLELGEDDRTAMAPIFDTLHKNNASNALAGEITSAILKQENQELERMQAQHNLDMQQATAVLKDQWKGDYDTNVNLIKGLFTSLLPGDMLDGLFTARMGTGKALFNSPEVMSAFAEVARKVNPAATLVPNVTNPRQTLEGRLGELQAMMKEPGWHDNKEANTELDQILVALEELKQQGQ